MGLRKWISGRSLSVIALLFLAVCLLTWGGVFTRVQNAIVGRPVDKALLAQALSEAMTSQLLPDQVVLDRGPKRQLTKLTYTFDEKIQNDMQKLFSSYDPDYGAFVAIDATTGRVLSMISYNPRDAWIKDHMALRATFPSASVFKVVTAAAAIAEKKVHADTLMSFNGRAHTLYKSHVLKDNRNRWTNTITLKDAFARSVNTVFGKLGVFIVGPTELQTYADRFGFNRVIHSDIPIQQGRAMISEDPWELAEAASGFTRTNTMSPLHGALIAAAIANDGKMMEPYVVQSVHALDSGEKIYEAQPAVSSVVIDPNAAEEMRELMRETIRSGTSRVSFRGFRMGPFGFVDVGGKTGSLTGDDPAGKYDWFVGYGSAGDQKIAVAALTISKEYWKVKSAFLARRAIENYFRERFALNVAQSSAHRTIASRSFRSAKKSKKKYVHAKRSKRRRHRD